MGAFKWTKEALRKEAAKYPTRQAFRRGNPSARTITSRLGYMEEFFGPPPFRWTPDLLRMEAEKYRTRTEFQTASWGAYEAARRLGLMDDLYPLAAVPWSESRLLARAAHYACRSDFAKAEGWGYKKALKTGILDELLPVRRETSTRDVVYMWRAQNVFHGGLPVYKFGVSSRRCGKRRIRQGERDSGFVAEDVVMQHAGEIGHYIETTLLSLGINPRFKYFSGCTEFRALNQKEITAANTIFEVLKCLV